MAILVTGFGPHGNIGCNPSWEAIRDNRLKINREGWVIITARLDATYDAANKFSEMYGHVWKQYNPVIVVHLGFEPNNKSFLQFEKFARDGLYVKEDINSYAPHANLASRAEGYVSAPPAWSATCFNLDAICDKLNSLHREGKIALLAKKSTEAGLDVCEYLYFRSLIQSSLRRVVFIYVPDVMNFGLNDITLALKYAIELIADHFQDDDCQAAVRSHTPSESRSGR